MEHNSEKQSKERSIQDYLSLGYIYLLVLGISREVIFYGFLDVNILSYSNVLDVLLSPIVILTSKLKVLLGLIVFAVLIYFLGKRQTKKKLDDNSISDSERIEIKNEALQGTLFLLALGVFAFFIGTGIGSGFKHSGELKKVEFEASHNITFLPSEEVKVKLIGNNSQYIFYVMENEKHVTISPIEGNVKSIEKFYSEE